MRYKNTDYLLEDKKTSRRKKSIGGESDLALSHVFLLLCISHFMININKLLFIVHCVKIIGGKRLNFNEFVFRVDWLYILQIIQTKISYNDKDDLPGFNLSLFHFLFFLYN